MATANSEEKRTAGPQTCKDTARKALLRLEVTQIAATSRVTGENEAVKDAAIAFPSHVRKFRRKTRFHSNRKQKGIQIIINSLSNKMNSVLANFLPKCGK